MDPGGTTAYALNAHNATISAYTITPSSGAIALVGNGIAGTTGMGPTDIAASSDNLFLYTRNGAGQSISVDRPWHRNSSPNITRKTDRAIGQYELSRASRLWVMRRRYGLRCVYNG